MSRNEENRKQNRKTNNAYNDRDCEDRSTNSNTSKSKNKRSANYNRNNGKSGVDRSTRNDFSWYNTIPELTQSAARFPFSRPLGTTVRLGASQAWASQYLTAFNEGQDALANTIPGIMTIHWNPTVGVSTSPISPVNVTSREIYSFVRHANSGASNYDAPDLMLYLLAMDSIYSAYIDGIRAYGLMMMYTKVNRYMPSGLVEALGYDFNDLKGNLAQFRWALNQVAYKISSLAVPNFMSYYLRHMWMNQGVYTDKDNAKAQMYAFVQDGYYQYDDAINSTTFAGLKYVHRVNNLTVDTWLQFMDDLINPILASEDMGIMSGDILKAFGSNNLFTVPPITGDYVVVPTYHPEVLSQIQNLSIIGDISDTVVGKVDTSHPDWYYTSSIIQSIDGENLEGYLYTRPVFKFHSETEGNKSKFSFIPMVDKLITSDSDVPDEASVMVSTRLTNTPDTSFTTMSTGSDVFYGFTQDRTCSTEVVAYTSIHYLANGMLVSRDIGTQGFTIDEQGGEPLDNRVVMLPNLLSKFDWNPTLPIVRRGADGDPVFIGYWQDTNNYTVMTADDLNRLHEVALMSEFYVPQIASATRKPSK